MPCAPAKESRRCLKSSLPLGMSDVCNGCDEGADTDLSLLAFDLTLPSPFLDVLRFSLVDAPSTIFTGAVEHTPPCSKGRPACDDGARKHAARATCPTLRIQDWMKTYGVIEEDGVDDVHRP